MQIYFAGPLFTPYERDFIAQAAARIRGDGRSIGSEGRPLEGKGLNLYVRGCIEEIGEVVSDLDDVVAILKRWQAELA